MSVLENRNRAVVVALASAAVFVSLLTIAEAQPETSATESATRETAPPQPKIIVPRVSDRIPPGERVKKGEGRVDWQAVKALLAKTRDQDAEFDRRLRAMALTRQVTPEERERLRPKGLRALAPEQLRQLKRVAPEAVARPRLPILAPVTAETASGLRLAARDMSFTAFGELPNGATFELIGTRSRIIGGPEKAVKARLAARHERLKRLEAIDAPFMISHHEQGVDLSFSKFNAAYQISIYCDDQKDTRCANDDYALSLAENLVILNEDAGGSQ